MSAPVKPEAEANEAEHHSDHEEEFYERVTSRYDKADARRVAEEDGVEAEDDADESDDDVEGSAADDAESEDTDEQTESDTSGDDRDGESAESDEDSEEGEESDQTDEESEDDAESDEDADSEEEDDEGGEPSDELRSAAAKHSIPLTLDDVKDPTARKLVTQKIAAMDAGFTRAMQEATAFRKERTQFQADKKFREENPELVVVELIQAATEKDPQFIEKVQARIDKLEDPDAKEAFKVILGKKREDAQKAVEGEMDASERRLQRADEVETHAKRFATKLGLPWRFAERAVVAALHSKRGDNPDLTNDEIEAAIRAEHKEWDRDMRAIKRDASKKRVVEKTQARKAAPPAKKAPPGSASPRPKPAKAKPYNDDDEDVRHERMMETARRVLPGRRDK